MSNHQSNAPALWRAQLPTANADSHKYSRGYLLIQGGYPITGAARLAAIAAARSGAGMTAIAVPEVAFAIYASQCLSILVKPYAPDKATSTLTTPLSDLIAEPRINAFLIGPGAGIGAQTLATTQQMLATGKPVVIDADAITSFDGQVALLRQSVIASCVLTPHDGEFTRLFGHPPGDNLATRLQHASQAAQHSEAIVLLKGAKTIIAAPDGRLLVNENAPPSLATAGTGDVLAGILSGLLAQGMPAFEASAAAAWLHGEAARLFGPGLIAEDLPGQLPAALSQCLQA